MCRQKNKTMDVSNEKITVITPNMQEVISEAYFIGENKDTLVCLINKSSEQALVFNNIKCIQTETCCNITKYNIRFDNNIKSQLIIDIDNEVDANDICYTIEVGPTANVDLVFRQQTAKQRSQSLAIELEIKAGANVTLSTLILGEDSTSNEITVNLCEEHSSVSLNGLYIQGGKCHTTTKVTVNHLVPHCQSNQLFKGIIKDEAFCEFSGLIKVMPNAQKTEAYQTSRNMLLSDAAHAKAEPHLEIYADDVKCSHGATSGQLDAQQLFYMQQRGIDEATAKRLLMAAFAIEVVERIPVESVRERLSTELTNIDL